VRDGDLDMQVGDLDVQVAHAVEGVERAYRSRCDRAPSVAGERGSSAMGVTHESHDGSRCSPPPKGPSSRPRLTDGPPPFIFRSPFGPRRRGITPWFHRVSSSSASVSGR
jgi:hypothetical protein